MAFVSKGGGFDIEAQTGQLYPGMMENPELRWGFIRKVYVILCFQLLLTVAVASVVVFVEPISHFVLHTPAGLAIYILSVVLTFIIMCPLHIYQKRHPVNLILLMVFTVLISFAVGLSCSVNSGKVVLEAGILTCAVVISLTLYTFWAAKRGHDFQFLGPFLFTSLLVLCLFGLIQVFFPMGELGRMIYGCIGAIIFSGFIIYDTDNLIKRYNYDEYVAAASALYLDIINLFLTILAILQGDD
ncbi:Transmembrane BAX inhibitor motif-containing protein 4 [Heracleum sosnowskyi]|uniref:Transmembrane BAX inhibitor motif-containing protein 4 n=1 Tax=Heracleum sosnowskyi TaxID=360622 RepID=A0AAD8I7N6_9APIA|nr:Transmembrane BAX inhibitor motif-containing protein 4 [Heracleum sosnowskyi]